jgi:hypothetical protein
MLVARQLTESGRLFERGPHHPLDHLEMGTGS